MSVTLSDRVSRALQTTVAGEVYTDTVTLERYSRTQGWYSIAPLAVLHPRSTEDIIHAVRVCRTLGISLIPRGAGTGLAGHAIGLGLIVDLSIHLHHIRPPGPDTVAVQPGVVLAELNRTLASDGRWFPVDPTSAPHCTIGGMIATNAAGWHGPRYGAMKDHVVSLTVVMADGSLCTIGPPDASSVDPAQGRLIASMESLLRPHAPDIRRSFPRVTKNSSGYDLPGMLDTQPLDLRKLIVGSEGTLGVVVEAVLRTSPLPVCTQGILLGASGYEPMVDLLTHLPPDVCAAAEFMDPSFLAYARFPPAWTTPRGNSLLFLDFHADSPGALDAMVDEATAVARRTAGVHLLPFETATDRETLFRCRREASEHMHTDRTLRKASFIEDGTVPIEHLGTYIDFLGTLLRSKGITYALYGHAANGNIHCAPLVDIQNLDHYRMIDEIASSVAEKLLALGGTLSGEHGDGYVRTPFLRRLYGELVYSLFTRIKETFDPDGTFHPGIIVGPQNTSIAHDLRFPQ